MKTRLKEVLAFVNNKGGVGKTTTVQNVAAGILRVHPDYRVLCIDLDPQCNLTNLLGWREHVKEINKNGHAWAVDVALRNGADNKLPVYKSSKGLFYVPASPQLAEIEPALHAQMSSKMVLADLFGNELIYMDGLYMGQKDKIKWIQDDFDYVLIDCAPALGELTFNALGAASGVVVPVQLGSLSVDGIGRIIKAFVDVRRKLNPELVMRGLLISMADERTNMAKDTIQYLRETYDSDVFQTRIRQCVKIGESQYKPMDIFQYAPDCTAAQDYAEFVNELLTTIPKE